MWRQRACRVAHLWRRRNGRWDFDARMLGLGEWSGAPTSQQVGQIEAWKRANAAAEGRPVLREAAVGRLAGMAHLEDLRWWMANVAGMWWWRK